MSEVNSESETGRGVNNSHLPPPPPPSISLSKDPATRLEQTRTDLRAICVLFLFYSALFFVIDPPHVEHPAPNVSNGTMNPFCLSFVVSFFLWRRMAFGRYLAIGFTWLFLLASIFTLLEVFPVPHLTVHGEPAFPGLSPTVLRIFIIPFLLGQIWQLRVLKRPEAILLVSSSHRVQEAAAAADRAAKSAHS